MHRSEAKRLYHGYRNDTEKPCIYYLSMDVTRVVSISWTHSRPRALTDKPPERR